MAQNREMSTAPRPITALSVSGTARSTIKHERVGQYRRKESSYELTSCYILCSSCDDAGHRGFVQPPTTGMVSSGYRGPLYSYKIAHLNVDPRIESINCLCKAFEALKAPLVKNSWLIQYIHDVKKANTVK